ncbi:MAG: dethiobiotin synthase [Oligoflexales bacterium]|nr:dethiobiotin synthase [Oligoflexales bacterium]
MKNFGKNIEDSSKEGVPPSLGFSPLLSGGEGSVRGATSSREGSVRGGNGPSQKKIFITGISTGVGKTIVSAILTEALEADYWKPIQCGDLDSSDSQTVRSLTSDKSHIFEEAFRLELPQSPHWAAKAEGLSLELDAFSLPKTDRPLVIEGAGGVLAPLNEKENIIDLAGRWQIPSLIVVTPYLGCLNHSCLTLEALEKRGIPFLGFVLNWEFPAEIKSFLQYKGPVLCEIPRIENLDRSTVSKLAAARRQSLREKLSWI